RYDLEPTSSLSAECLQLQPTKNNVRNISTHRIERIFCTVRLVFITAILLDCFILPTAKVNYLIYTSILPNVASLVNRYQKIAIYKFTDFCFWGCFAVKSTKKGLEHNTQILFVIVDVVCQLLMDATKFQGSYGIPF
ncbi:MAG: hypothetical protein IJF66_02280, partial [Clostridia bacterium]|nr:hypothetical protein [Clostridia bacterium]